MKDSLYLLATGIAFVALFITVSKYFGSDVYMFIMSLTMTAITVDNFRLRRQLRQLREKK